MKGIITDIQRFSVHDGPGIRTTVFLKGCSNRCAWCHNPETFTVKPQLEFFSERCIACGRCLSVCQEGVHSISDGRHIVDLTLCNNCGQCIASCYVGALVVTGQEMTSEEVMEQIRMDEPYYKRSGGGITLSGGEPVMQWEFAKEILLLCKELGIHTTLQTAGNYDFEYLSALVPYLDLVMYDIKAFSEDIYKNVIHGDPRRILNNLMDLDCMGIPIIVRTPVVGSVNDTEQEIEAIATYLGDMKHLVHYMLIPYHGLGKVKYDALGMEYNNTFYTPDKERMQQLERIAARYVKVYNNESGYING
ncbi:MAG: glycyl-radical enzyme activating protein family [Herbinix sp.]|jgi:pyruvate formate lyase activating enzyme|nr:glycyl-radical enzyme activating protein family [Herbinix sp.]